MESNVILRFPTERTPKGKQDEAMRIYEEARDSWFKCCDEFTYARAELMGLPKEDT